MRKPQFKNKVAKGAFTLIEILVVLVIMGFLISLVAPKLAGVVEGAIDNNCDTNQERLRKILNVNYIQKSTLPANLTNLVIKTSDGYVAPTVNDNNRSNGAEMLSDEFKERFNSSLHFINAAEATELNGLGLGSVLTYAEISEAKGDAEATGIAGTVTAKNVQEDVKENLAMLIVGPGAADKDATIDPTSITEPMSEALSLGRIILGVSQQSEFVTSGMVDQAGICPGQLQNSENFAWGNYVLLVPRLKATGERYNDGTDAVKGVTVTGYEDEDATIANFKTTLDFTEAQGAYSITSSCPEGHTWAPISETFKFSAWTK